MHIFGYAWSVVMNFYRQLSFVFILAHSLHHHCLLIAYRFLDVYRILWERVLAGQSVKMYIDCVFVDDSHLFYRSSDSLHHQHWLLDLLFLFFSMQIELLCWLDGKLRPQTA